MVQSLLEQRFRLRLHREKREIPVYEMVVTKSGPKLKPAAPEADIVPHNSASGRNWVVKVGSMSTKRLAELVENQGFVGRPVIDQTGLAGNYAVQLAYTPDIPPNRGSDAPDDISIFTALVEQLGLRLQPAKAMVDTIVVDHVEKPSAN